MTSHCQAIEAHLRRGATLTALECLDLFQCMNLKGRISDLRRSGVNVLKRWIKLPNGKRVAEYYLPR
jgi:hypothetical protein